MPKIQLKTITQQSFEVEIDDSGTVLQLKNKITETKGDDYPVDGQKLIYNGKVLDDEKTIGEIKIVPGKFIVVMVVKKTVPKASVVSTTTTSTGETKKAAGEEVKKEKTPPPKAKQAEVPAEHQQAVDNITAMGYPREEVIRALKAAFFNADRAVEYLCSGIPEGLNLVQGAGDASGDEGGGEANAAVGEGAQGGVDFLGNLPQFALLREMIRNDPTALPEIMQQIAENRPELMEIIRNNQEQFLALLNAEGGAAGAQPVAAAGGVGGGGEAIPGQAVTIAVTAGDRAAIDRLCGMGFPEQLVIEAYLACDKNEDLAVNYILQRMEENQGGN